jgi:cysteine-rich repeat protein
VKGLKNKNFIYKPLLILLCLGLGSGIVFCLNAGIVKSAGISTSVTITACGNNIVESGEGCDDGNVVSGDGCSSTCQTEVAPGGGGGYRPTPYEEVVYYTRVILEGKAYPDALITILKDGQFLSIIQADFRADFKIEIKDLTPGTYTFGLWAEDKNGVRSPTFTITFYIAPAVTTVVSGILLPPTIKLSKNIALKGETIDISGQAIPDGKVDLFISSLKPLQDVFYDSAITDSNGDWYYLLDTAKLKEGTYEVKAKVISRAGLLSIFSKALSIETTLIKPLVPPKPPVPPIPGVCPNADLNKDNKVNLVDFSILLYWWGKPNECTDQNSDGVVNLIDFSIMLYYWSG